MIERWFPCAEVSEASTSGWGSGKSEKALFTWFAARPLAQARAAVLTSLLPWPEEESEQRRLQDLVRKAMAGRDAAHAELVAELAKTYPQGASLLDPFSGRGMIPLEAARLGSTAHGVDYSPVATLAGQILADFPLRDWTSEPDLPFSLRDTMDPGSRLLDDVRLVLDEIGRRYADRMGDVYPMVDGKQPWGYLWAITLPCQECGHRFPLTGSLALRHPLPVKSDPGQSFCIEADRHTGEFRAVVHNGPPTGLPTLVSRTRDGKAVKGKSAVCPFCDHVHSKQTHQRLAQEGLGADCLLVAADIDERVGKTFREPNAEERVAVERAAALLAKEAPFDEFPAVPTEGIPIGNSDTVRASVYGARTYGDLCNPRQTLGFVRLARVISDLGTELADKLGLSDRYATALTAYASSVLVRKLKSSTRGATLRLHNHRSSNRVQVNHIFTNEASLGFSYDYFETGLGDGPGTWPSLADDTIAVLRNQASRTGGCPADIQRGSALALPFPDGSVSAVVADPPYDNMIDYSDASDLFYVWLKRALYSTAPWFAFTSHELGVQEKAEEIIVKRFRAWKTATDHRTREHYDTSIARAFAEARRVVRRDGVVTIVFGHGDPEVWHRLLEAITSAGLVLTGSWPAKTEAGGSAGSANIVTTLTMSCRPSPSVRPAGRANLVEAEVRKEVKARIPMWDAAGLAPTDQLMASAGPAMEAVGRYEQVLNHLGDPVDPAHYLVVARRAVEEAAAVVIDHLPLETFDTRTRFALSWARLYRRSVAPKSEARWQALAADLASDELKGVLEEADKGVRLGYAKDWKGTPSHTSATIDVAMAMAKAWPEGLDAVAEVLVATGRDNADNYLWAAIRYLSSLLPEADPDAVAWTSLVRGRSGIGAVTRGVVAARREATELEEAKHRQPTLFDISWQTASDDTHGELVVPAWAEEEQP
jgi:adenine-specific DNA methylase